LNRSSRAAFFGPLSSRGSAAISPEIAFGKNRLDLG